MYSERNGRQTLPPQNYITTPDQLAPPADMSPHRRLVTAILNDELDMPGPYRPVGPGDSEADLYSCARYRPASATDEPPTGMSTSELLDQLYTYDMTGDSADPRRGEIGAELRRRSKLPIRASLMRRAIAS